jgi:hypothetical protein
MAAHPDRPLAARFGRHCWQALVLGLACGVSAAAEPVPSKCEQGLHQSVSPPAAPTVLIVLSPRMPYALQEWPRMRALAEQAGFQIRAFRDPGVPSSEWEAGLEAAGLPELQTAPVLDQQVAADCRLLNHAPSALVGRCDRWHAWPVLGVMPDAAWLAVLNERREAIACS